MAAHGICFDFITGPSQIGQNSLTAAADARRAGLYQSLRVAKVLLS